MENAHEHQQFFCKAKAHSKRSQNCSVKVRTYLPQIILTRKKLIPKKLSTCWLLFWIITLSSRSIHASDDLPFNRWVELRKDPVGARPGSSIRYVPEVQSFFLWGFMNADPDLLQERPLMQIPEYDMVVFNPTEGRWRSHFPKEWEAQWRKVLPLAYIPRTYSGITSGSERTVLRGSTEEKEGAPRPDLNLVFDQVAYRPSSKALIYFTGGLTSAYDVIQRRWSDLNPKHWPPPAMAGSLAYDPIHDEMVLFGGGHVAEKTSTGKVVGYTGTWVYRFADNDWHRLSLATQPPPRMNTRLVYDARDQVLVLFGGDGQSHYLADTWLYDLKTRTWSDSKASAGPEARAGHFTVYDPETGWVIIGGGYNRKDLTDMWAFDAALDRWFKLKGDVPIGFTLSADIAPEKRLIVLVTSSRSPEDRMTCNILFPVRTTYGYRLQREALAQPDSSNEAKRSIPKRVLERQSLNQEARKAPADKLHSLPVNQWMLLDNPGRVAPNRTWGSATFDTNRELILYWGGGHCGYEGNDVDAYDIQNHTWNIGDPTPEYPERTWNHGVRPGGVTFQGKPWTEHGRKIYAYDPVSRKMIMNRPIRLTTGYNPPALRLFPSSLTSDYQSSKDALVSPPSSYVKYVTWTYDPETTQWELLCGAPMGLDQLVTTRHGVMAVNVNWPSRLNDAGYLLPWSPSLPPEDKAIFLLNAATRRWERLSQGQPSPQNLYEQTSLAYDPVRDQVILHGGGERRDELWIFDIARHQWNKMIPKVIAPSGALPPVCSRESVFLPQQDAYLIYGSAVEGRDSPGVWAYKRSENTWYAVDIPWSPKVDLSLLATQNRAMVYDPKRDLVLLVLGTSGDEGKAVVYALRYRHGQAQFVKDR